MSDIHPATYNNDVVHPACKKCGTPMTLRRLRASRFDYYVGKFGCDTCGRMTTAVAKFESVPIAPQLPMSGNDNLTGSKTPVGT
jgi:hypothetical protein